MSIRKGRAMATAAAAATSGTGRFTGLLGATKVPVIGSGGSWRRLAKSPFGRRTRIAISKTKAKRLR
ncbi:hypothetical protein D3C86_2162970 [compost metagenome]